MNPAKKRGSATEDRIQAILQELSGSCFQIPEQKDVFHRDLVVQISTENLTFYVQAKTLTSANLVLKAKHVKDWQNQREPIFIMYWDENLQRLYWVSLWHHLLRKPLTGKTTKLHRRDDLHLLYNQQQTTDHNKHRWNKFLECARSVCCLWAQSIGQISRDWPPYLSEVILQPDILPYVLIAEPAVDILTSACPELGPLKVRKLLFQIAPKLQESVEQALSHLQNEISLSPDAKQALRKPLERWYHEWICGISSSQRIPALNHLLNLVGPQEVNNFKLPAYSCDHARPLISLVKLIPADLLVGRLEDILLKDTDLNNRLYATYVLSQLDHSDAGRVLFASYKCLIKPEAFEGSSPGDDLRHDPRLLRKEVLWAAAKQGVEEAYQSILRTWGEDGDWDYLIRMNWTYYGGRPENVFANAKLHIEGMLKGDRLMIRPHQLMYQAHKVAVETGRLTI